MSSSITTSFDAQSVFTTFLNSSSDGVVVYSISQMQVILANPAMERMLQYSAADMAKFEPDHFMPEFQPNGEKSIDKFNSILEKLLAGKSIDFEFVSTKANGNPFYAAVKAFKISGEKEDYILFIHRDIGHKFEKNNSIDINKEQFEFLFENAFDGMIIYDEQLDRHIQCNEKLLRYFELESKEELLANYWDYSREVQLEEKNLESAKKDIIEQIKILKNYRYKWNHKTAKGKFVSAEILSMSLTRENQNFVLSFFKDITTEENDRRELEKNKRDLLNAQVMAQMASFRYDVEEDILDWSEYAFQTFGIWPLDSPKNMTYFTDRLHSEDRSYVLEILFLASSNNCSIETEFRLFDFNNEIIHVRFKADPIQEDGKQIFVGTVQNISFEKLNMIALEESNRRYIDLFDNMYDALLIVDEDRKILECNFATERIFGYSRQELKKMTVSELVHPDDFGLAKDLLKQLINDGSVDVYTGRIIRKDGKIRYLQGSSTAIYKNGVFSGSRDMARDVTELKEADDKKEKLLQELENVNKELKDFAYVVSHDLKAPLRAITSLSSWLLEDYSNQIDAAGLDKLKLLNNRVHRMHSFIEAILEYSKLGESKVYKELVDIHKVIDTSIEILGPPANFIIEISPDIPKFYGHGIRVSQLFQNLLSNAIKYNDKAVGEVKISCIEDDEYLNFSFQDNGPGIPEKDFENIFQIFKTLQAKDEFESTGIGLTIVKRIVDLYEGEISINSKLGKGTCFKFSLLKKNPNL